MSVLQDLVAEIESYPSTYLTVEVIDVDPPGSAINVGEVVNFRIQVTNAGPLELTGVNFTVTGLNGTQVKSGSAIDDFGPEATSNTIDVLPAHRPNVPVEVGGSVLSLKATRTFSTVRDLIRVSVRDWNTSLDHVLIAHSDPDEAASATYASTVAAA